MKLLRQSLIKQIPLFSLILSLVVAWMIIPITTGFPMVAFVIFFIGLSTLIVIVKKDKSWVDAALYLGILALSAFTLIRANEFLLFFDFIFIIFFIATLTKSLTNIPSIFHVLLSPLSVFCLFLFISKWI